MQIIGGLPDSPVGPAVLQQIPFGETFFAILYGLTVSDNPGSTSQLQNITGEICDAASKNVFFISGDAHDTYVAQPCPQVKYVGSPSVSAPGIGPVTAATPSAENLAASTALLNINTLMTAEGDAISVVASLQNFGRWVASNFDPIELQNIRTNTPTSPYVYVDLSHHGYGVLDCSTDPCTSKVESIPLGCLADSQDTPECPWDSLFGTF